MACEAYSAMVLSSPVNLSDIAKLEVLRRLDQFRRWRSLDEKRYCLVCGEIITGKQIQVKGGTRGDGPLRLNCPTVRCHSIPMDWVLPTDEVLANVALRETQRSNVPAVHLDPGARENSIASRLRKLAGRFTRPV
jgi:hypothetical protein